MVLGRGKRSAAFLAAAAMAVVSAGGRAAAQQAPIDPPARVGRISRIAGTVSFHLAGADQWEPASINLPVTTGSAFWAEPGARADLEIEGDHLVMGQATELDTTLLDDNTTALALPQGEVVLLEPASAVPGAVSVQTPRAAVTFRGAGRYEVIAGDTAAPTRVTVIEGAADVTGPGVTLHVGPGQTATLSGDIAVPPLQASLGPAVHDALLDGVLAEQQHPSPHRAVPPPAIVLSMTGGDALEEYGDWATVPDDGPIWYPPAASGFVPYRDGHWAFVAPWGWTWVAEAPWGFAPSHYGRWAEIRGRWGWLPGREVSRERPVYAPALVGFLAGVALGAATAHSVGWVPLGPREPYIPAFRASNAYLLAVNRRAVPNVEAVIAARERPGARPVPLANIRGVTVVPAAAMLDSRGVAAAARPLPQGAAPPRRFEGGRPPIVPSFATVGMTPPVARALHVPDRAEAGTSRPHGPGPALRPAGLPRPGRIEEALPTVAGPPRPGVVGGAAVGAALGAAGAAGVAILRPHEPGLPALRPPGERGGLRPSGGAPGPALPARRPEIGGEPRAVEPPRTPGQPPLPHVEGPTRAPQRGPETPPTSGIPRAEAIPHVDAPHVSVPRPGVAPPSAAPNASAPHVFTPPPQARPANRPPPQAHALPPQRPAPAPLRVAPNHAPLQPQPAPTHPAPVRPSPPTAHAPPRPAPPRVEAPHEQPRPQPQHQQAPHNGAREEHRP